MRVVCCLVAALSAYLDHQRIRGEVQQFFKDQIHATGVCAHAHQSLCRLMGSAHHGHGDGKRAMFEVGERAGRRRAGLQEEEEEEKAAGTEPSTAQNGAEKARAFHDAFPTSTWAASDRRRSSFA